VLYCGKEQQETLTFYGLSFPNPVVLFYSQCSCSSQLGIGKTDLEDRLERRLALEGTHWARTHGDLHTQNILVSYDSVERVVEDVFVIDFASFGPNHASIDLAKLEASILLFVAPTAASHDVSWFREALILVEVLARDLCLPETEAHGEPLYCSTVTALKNVEFSDVRLQRIARTIHHLRECGLKRIGSLSETEYRLALLSRVFCMVRYSQLQCDAQRYLGVAYAGFLAQQLIRSL